MSLSVRTRFEVFKRDNFTCQYCGRKSPEVILEADHIVPVCAGGTDDVMNLRTSCWECNHGKAGKPLADVVTGEDPHDRAILLLERERQLREYNEVLRVVNERVAREYDDLYDYWPGRLNQRDRSWLRNALERYPSEMIRRAMTTAVNADSTDNLAYVNACLRNWHGPKADA
jgi:hypothetical protein